jgi:acetyl esterase/lipase/Fe-S cluster assembly iron-binding protein IscA
LLLTAIVLATLALQPPAPPAPTATAPAADKAAQPTAPAPAAIPTDIVAARAAFKTRILDTAPKGDGTEPDRPGSTFSLITYKSPAGDLAAYLTADPKDGQKRPAIIVCTGGFGGIGDDSWLVERFTGHFRNAGMVVMCPSWRGQQKNPGVAEGFYGELDDALAAVDFVRALPYVDPARVYITGHSTGGTISLMVAEATDKVRASFPLGPCYDMAAVTAEGKFYGDPSPFDTTNPMEVRLRSPIEFIAGLRAPTFSFEGRLSPNDALSTDANQRATRAGKPFTAFSIRDGDHFNIVDPVNALIAAKIAADTGPVCAIAVSDGEVQKAFATRRLPFTPRDNADTKSSVVSFTRVAVDTIVEQMKAKNLDPEKVYVRAGINPYFRQYVSFEEEAVRGDLIYEFKGFKLVMDPLSTRLMRGTLIGYNKGGGFSFRNPNEN